MSKLSIHISGSPTGLGSLLTKCFDAGSPVGVLYSLNQNLNDDIARYSPPTKWVYRRQTEEFNRLPNGFFTGDPVKSAQDWLVNTKDAADKNRSQIENILLNSPTWADVLNEPAIEIADPSDPVQVAEAIRRAKWLNTWMVTALEIAHSYGVKLAMFSFPTQSPPSDARIWNELLPSLRLGKQYGAILSCIVTETLEETIRLGIWLVFQRLTYNTKASMLLFLTTPNFQSFTRKRVLETAITPA